jgi:hypothetical protein
MTKTYLIHAYGVRPFISWLEIEAGTPEEAVAKARCQDTELLDAAEECNSGYPWSEFTVYDQSGKQLLRVLDAEARPRETAPALLEALKDLLGDLPSVQGGICRHCGREYEDIQSGNCPSDDCPAFHARAVIAQATAPTTQNDHD